MNKELEKTPTQKTIDELITERLEEIKIKLENSDIAYNSYQESLSQGNIDDERWYKHKVVEEYRYQEQLKQEAKLLEEIKRINI